MAGVFQNIDPMHYPLTARLWCWGRTHSLGGEGGGGQYFGRRQTQLCTLRMQVLCVFTPSHPATTAAFKSYLSSLHVYSLTNTVSPLRACLSIWWERFRDSQKEYDRGPLSIQSSLLLTNKLNPIASKKQQTLFNIYFTQWPRNNKT